MAREYFTVDLWGLRAALAARAAERRMTESDVLRSALAWLSHWLQTQALPAARTLTSVVAS